MVKVLHIIANPKKENSYSRNLANEFLTEYSKINPEDEIETLDLYDVEIPYVNMIDLQAIFKQGKDLNEKEKKRMDFKDKLINQLKSADKIIVTSPMWNFGIPAILKAYIDHIVVVGKTFQYSSQGPEGLLKNKKICFVMARGGTYGENHEFEIQGKYLKAVFGFLGITDQIELVIENTGRTEGKEENWQKAVQNAKQKASKF